MLFSENWSKARVKQCLHVLCQATAQFIQTYSIDEPFFSVTCTPSIVSDIAIFYAPLARISDERLVISA